jgi:hypothetical protein
LGELVGVGLEDFEGLFDLVAEEEFVFSDYIYVRIDMVRVHS